ncbi:hypothetical protein Ancab_037675 [Ancistrocladus abbreviatus]
MAMYSQGENEYEEEEHSHLALEDQIEHIISTLPKEKGWLLDSFYQYHGFWFEKPILQGLIICQKSFEARPSNVILASYPKSGTTWLKALLFTIMNRCSYDDSTHPLLTCNPHDCIPSIEFYACNNPSSPIPDTPLLGTHIPYTLLPESIKQSNCPIIYVSRDAKDVLNSFWHFLNKLRAKELPRLSLEETFDFFSSGVSTFGPYWDHLLGYWKASLEFPNQVLFIRYEDVKRNPTLHAKRLAEFIGHSFSFEEEGQGVVQKIVDFCSFENLSNLEINKATSTKISVPGIFTTNEMFFRKAQVGDYKNYLNEEMIKRLEEIMEQKLKRFGWKTI